MVYARVHQYALEPTLQRQQGIFLPVLIKLMNVFEQFHKPFVHDLFRFFIAVGIPVTDFHGKAPEQVIELLLAVAVVPSAAIQQ